MYRIGAFFITLLVRGTAIAAEIIGPRRRRLRRQHHYDSGIVISNQISTHGMLSHVCCSAAIVRSFLYILVWRALPTHSPAPEGNLAQGRALPAGA